MIRRRIALLLCNSKHLYKSFKKLFSFSLRNILVILRIQKGDSPQARNPLSPDFAKQFASNGNANMAVGEEVTEYLLMRSIVDDQLQRVPRSPVEASGSSEYSFSFKVSIP